MGQRDGQLAVALVAIALLVASCVPTFGHCPDDIEPAIYDTEPMPVIWIERTGPVEARVNWAFVGLAMLAGCVGVALLRGGAGDGE